MRALNTASLRNKKEEEEKKTIRNGAQRGSVVRFFAAWSSVGSRHIAILATIVFPCLRVSKFEHVEALT